MKKLQTILLMIAIVGLLAGCQQEKGALEKIKNFGTQYKNKNIGIASVSFSKNIMAQGENGSIGKAREELIQKSPETTSQDIKFLQDVGKQAVDGFLKNFTSVKPIEESLDQNCYDAQGITFVPPYPYNNLDSNIAERFCKKYGLDAAVKIEFSYFYYTANKGNLDAIVNIFNNVGHVVDAYSKSKFYANQVGINTTVIIYDHQGNEILNEKIALFGDVNEDFVIPGFRFHLFDEIKEKIEKVTQKYLEFIKSFC